jgi:glutamate-5-semialdehyde dehydrogenase
MASDEIILHATAARDASRELATVSTEAKNAVLLDLAESIGANTISILAANELDLAAARHAGLAAPKIARLGLTAQTLAQTAQGLRQVAALPDPIGSISRDQYVPSGLHVQKVRIPLGVIAMIYEARPAVTVDAFALCFKAGNASILKGGKEAERSNAALAALIHGVLDRHQLPRASAAVMSTLSRDQLRELLTLDTLIDLVIPRGGTDLIAFVREHSKIPTVQHATGVCHIFVDESADVDAAVRVCINAKTSAPAACNALECVLVHQAIAPRFVPALATAMASAGVELRGDPAFASLAPGATQARDADFGSEFLDLILAGRVVPGLDQAIEHIRRHSSGHTESILTASEENARSFIRRVGSSCVLVNASTRFNDGFQLGLGAEIGISTSRVHAFGPMGLEELTTQRYVVHGSYHTR